MATRRMGVMSLASWVERMVGSGRSCAHAARRGEVDLLGAGGAVAAAWVAEPGHRGVEFVDDAGRLDAHAAVELHAAGGVRILDQGQVVAALQRAIGRGPYAP